MTCTTCNGTCQACSWYTNDEPSHSNASIVQSVLGNEVATDEAVRASLIIRCQSSQVLTWGHAEIVYIESRENATDVKENQTHAKASINHLLSPHALTSPLDLIESKRQQPSDDDSQNRHVGEDLCRHLHWIVNQCRHKDNHEKPFHEQ
jgi:hypothetical protein